MSISPVYTEQYYPIADGIVIPGWPLQGQVFQTCMSNCDAYGLSCVGFSFRENNPASPFSECWIYSSITNWRTDGLCGYDGKSFCRGFKRNAGSEIINTQVFRRESYPYSDQVLAGYPVYNLQSATQCASQCESLGNQCGGFTFKVQNPSIPNDYNICWLHPFGSVWRNDGICDPNLCQGWSKYQSAGYPGGSGGYPVDQNSFQRAPNVYGDGGTLPGYPTYDTIRTAYDCSQQCLNNGACAGFTFKDKDLDNPNDHYICWLNPVGTTWRDDGICSSLRSGNLCQGWIKRDPNGSGGGGYPGPQVDRYYFDRAPNVYGEGGTLPGYPTYDTIRTAYDCSERCLAVGNCAGFTFKDRDPTNSGDHYICWLKEFGTVWRDDGICISSQGGNLCQGWVKKTTTPGGGGGGGGGDQPDRSIFKRAPYPYPDGGMIPGYPTYNIQQNTYECSKQCEYAGNDCIGFMFKKRNPAITSDNTICFLTVTGVNWRNDDICFQNGYQLCDAWVKI